MNRYKVNNKIDTTLDGLTTKIFRPAPIFELPPNIILRDYQLEAIENWAQKKKSRH